jgi:hypothetical protein
MKYHQPTTAQEVIDAFLNKQTVKYEYGKPDSGDFREVNHYDITAMHLGKHLHRIRILVSEPAPHWSCAAHVPAEAEWFHHAKNPGAMYRINAIDEAMGTLLVGNKWLTWNELEDWRWSERSRQQFRECRVEVGEGK